MTTLLVQDLKSELVHDFALALQTRQSIGAFILFLYLHDSPSGTFTFEILKDAQVIFSKSFTSSDIKTAMDTSEDYLYAFYPIMPDDPIHLERGEYQAKLSATGYKNGNSFLGWVQQHENVQNEMAYTPSNDSANPLAMRIKVLKQGII